MPYPFMALGWQVELLRSFLTFTAWQLLLMTPCLALITRLNPAVAARSCTTNEVPVAAVAAAATPTHNSSSQQGVTVALQRKARSLPNYRATN